MGYETHMVIESADHETLSPIEMCRAILEHDPAMILLLDHLRYETPYLPRNLPLLTWIQDPLPNLLCRRAGESIGPMDFVCGYYFDQCTQEHGYSARAVHAPWTCPSPRASFTTRRSMRRPDDATHATYPS